MKKLEIMNTLTRTFNRAGLKISKHSPELMVIGGVIGGVTAAVMACRATTKLSETLAESKEEIDQIKYYKEHLDAPELKGEWTEADCKKDLRIAYAHYGFDIVRLYGPAVVLGGVSIAAILSGHNILRKRNLALAAAYTGLDKAFKDYRGRVVERFGDALDKELRYNIRAQEVEETVTDENGKETTVKKTAEVADPDAILASPYAKFFDASCIGWDKDPELNMMTLRKQQDYANNILRSRGHLFLNEVYDMLGIPRTTEGAVVGWIYSKDNPIGDNFVDFGIYLTNVANRRFVNGYEAVVLLDFNVDGEIYKKI